MTGSSKSSSHPEPKEAGSPRAPVPPLMRIVTKGGWRDVPDRYATVEELAEENRIAAAKNGRG